MATESRYIQYPTVWPVKRHKVGHGGYRNYATHREVRMGETIHKLRRELRASEALLVFTQNQLRHCLEINGAAIQRITAENFKLTRQLQSARRRLKRWKNKHKASL